MTDILVALEGEPVVAHGVAMIELSPTAPSVAPAFTFSLDDNILSVTITNVGVGGSHWLPLFTMNTQPPLARLTPLAPIPLEVGTVVLGDIYNLVGWLGAVEDLPSIYLQVVPLNEGGEKGTPAIPKLINAGVEPPLPIIVTADPSFSFNGGEVVGAVVTVIPPAYIGGPLVPPMVIQYLISDDDGAIEYDGDDPEFDDMKFNELEEFTTPGLADETWEGERFAVRYTLNSSVNTVVVWTTVSAVITDEDAEIIPLALGPDDWGVTARPANSPNEATHHVRQYEILKPGLTPSHVQWLNAAIVDISNPDSFEAFWNPCLLDGDLWDHRVLDGSADREIVNGAVANNLRIRYRMTETSPWSPVSTDNKQLVYEAPPPPAPNIGWHHMRMREAEEVSAGLLGGGGEQWWHYAERSISDPSLIVACQDTGGTWFSEDSGVNWRKSQDGGLRAYNSVSVAIDPDDRNVWIYAGGTTNSSGEPGWEGIYRTVDRGVSWEIVNNFAARGTRVAFRRTRCTAFAYDRTSAATPTTRTVYAVIPIGDGTEIGSYVRAELWRSNGGGQSGTWTKVRDLATNTFSRFNTLKHHPTQAGRLVMATDNGFWETTDFGVTWTKRNFTGAGGNQSVITVEYNPADANELYICVSSLGDILTASPIGIWRTTTGPSGTWTRLNTPANFPCSQVAIGNQNGGGWGPVGSRTLYLIGRSPGNHMLRASHDGGASWFTPVAHRKPGANAESGDISEPNSGGSANGFRPTQMLPHPTNRDEMVIHARAKVYRTNDRGVNIVYSGQGFEGQQFASGFCGIAFCEGADADAYKRFIIGVTDTGAFVTVNGGISFHHIRPRANDPADTTPPIAKLKNSANGVAISPDNPVHRIFSVGHINLGPTHLFRTLVADPGDEASGDIQRINGTRSPEHPKAIHWHKSKPGRVYFQSYRFANANGVGLPTTQNYGSGMNGDFVAAWPGNNDIIMARSGQTFRWSQDEGNTWAEYVNIGWNPFALDSRYVMLAWHPTNNQIIFTISSGKDLARYNKTTNTWKTNYNLLGRIKSDYPAIGNGVVVRLASIAIDPQDPDVGAVTITAYGYCACYRSLNFQSDNPTWEDVTFNAPRQNPGVLKYHPFTGDLFRGFRAHGGAYVLPPPEGASRPKPSLTPPFIIP